MEHQLTIVSDGTREGTSVFLPNGDSIAGVNNVEFSLNAAGEPLTTIQFVGVNVDIDVKPEILQDRVDTWTMPELMRKQAIIASEVKRRKNEAGEQTQQDCVVQVPLASDPGTMVGDRGVASMILPEFGKLLPDLEDELLPEDPS